MKLSVVAVFYLMTVTSATDPQGWEPGDMDEVAMEPCPEGTEEYGAGCVDSPPSPPCPHPYQEYEDECDLPSVSDTRLSMRTCRCRYGYVKTPRRNRCSRCGRRPTGIRVGCGC